tara:strand:- start:2879 stop:6478 length:3600 start_codon:yes stop_codon:yes gene_type:complete
MSDSDESPEFHPDDYPSSNEEDIEEEIYPRGVTPLDSSDLKTVSAHRKAFVKWVNEDFYPKVVKATKESSLNVYQVLIQKYLGLPTPYRGLLVYHGLGTGKTASAVSLAEGLSSDLRINTLLPASLETEFIKEVRNWGLNELQLNQRWTHRLFKDMSKDELKEVKELYGLDGVSIVKISKKTKSEYKKKLIQESESSDVSLEKQIRLADKHINSLKGFWIPEGSPLAKGESKLYEESEGEEDEGSNDRWSAIERECILQQVNFLISKKYNFIHYRPFPKVEKTDLKEFRNLEDEEDEDIDDEMGEIFEEETKDTQTHNQRIVKNLEKSLKYNRKHYDIDSPFHKEVIIIDEVHNFVRQILNKSKPSLVFYDWIVNARDVKIVFLSGTPVINNPCEIAILYNMLYGKIRVFNFTVKTTMSPEDMTEKLQEIIYEKPSPIELFYVEQNQGKLVVSFIQERSGFESLKHTEEHDDRVYTIMTQDSSFQDFIDAIYESLEKATKDPITPSKSEFAKLSVKAKKEIYRGDIRIYDEELDLPFNRQQKLFDIYDNGQLIDMTRNEEFVNYFFESGNTIPPKKKTLLRRMLMGLTSYYPIDRSSIVLMPQVVKPTINADIYRDYAIVKDLNIVPCYMSQLQFEKYYEAIEKEKSWDKRRLSQGHQSSGEEAWHYHTRTRQGCNMVFQNDDFRLLKKTKANESELEEEKQKVYSDLLEKQSLRDDKNLDKLSPKMFQILKNIKNFTKQSGDSLTSTGKILFYSDFRSDAGSEAFELVLKSNGYEKFDYKRPQDTKGLRYTFITGSEDPEERRVNKEFYNEDSNKYGEYIQIMIISSAGAEGLSLKCVRQVHILEPYWNYVRIDQVLGRAIRMKSHMSLDEKERNVEQYLYLSVLPSGLNLDSVYESVKQLDTWSVPEWSDVKTELSKVENRTYKELLENAVNLNINDNSKTTDQYLFDVMEHKYTVSLQINDIIKESALDCIPHTKDDPQLNDRCIRFSDSLAGEIAYFPGISARVLETIDVIQLRSQTLYYIKPNIYVVAGESKGQKQRFVYYEYSLKDKETRDDIDIRYLRENATRLADMYVNERMLLVFSPKDHPVNQRLGKEFSVYQDQYVIDEDIITDYLQEDKFPSLSKLTTQSHLLGYKLKYNVNNTFYYMEKEVTDESRIMKMYPYTEYEADNYITWGLVPVYLHKGGIYLGLTYRGTE